MDNLACRSSKKSCTKESAVPHLVLMDTPLPAGATIIQSSCGTCKQENSFTPSQDTQPQFAVLLLVLMDRYLPAGVATFALTETQKLSYGTYIQESYSARSLGTQPQFAVLLLVPTDRHSLAGVTTRRSRFGARSK